MVKLMSIISKLRKDILPQYETEVELFENKEGDPIMLYTFFFDKDEEGE
jgi:hypothetical protein